jgi:tubulin polyglutamylase TTLL9
MRIYVLVLSYQPLKVYLYREGFARFTNTPYSTAKSDLKNPYVHLTNHAIQKRDVDYDPSVDDLKMPIQDLYTHMRSAHGQDAADRCFAGMHGVIINALRSVSQVMINDKHCYELYGYDIMIDAELRPWLIEVNASPSMSSDSQSDVDLKAALLDDTFTCLDAEEVFEGRTPPRVGGFDLVCEDGKLTRTAEWGGLPTLLGADNSDRLEALERLRRWCKKGKAGEERAKARSAALVAATGMPPIVHW